MEMSYKYIPVWKVELVTLAYMLLINVLLWGG